MALPAGEIKDPVKNINNKIDINWQYFSKTYQEYTFAIIICLIISQRASELSRYIFNGAFISHWQRKALPLRLRLRRHRLRCAPLVS